MDNEESLVTKQPKDKKIKKEYILLIIIVLLIIVFDQATKIYIVNKEEMQIIPNILKFAVTQNTKPAYGIGSNSTVMYVLTNAIILSVIFKFVTTQNEYVDRKLKIFLSFIFAGGISNVIDRIFRGYVIEFIDFNQLLSSPILNIADIFTIIGWVSIVAIFAVFTVNEWRKNKK